MMHILNVDLGSRAIQVSYWHLEDEDGMDVFHINTDADVSDLELEIIHRAISKHYHEEEK